MHKFIPLEISFRRLKSVFLTGFKNIDTFKKNIIIVFAGISLFNFFNLLYQLLVAHKLSAAEFAAFNSLLSMFLIITAPLGTLQMAVAKYSAEFNAHNQIAKLRFLFSDLLKKTSVLAISVLLVFWLASVYLMNLLKIPSVSCGYILAVLIALDCLMPVFSGGVQGLELFRWVAAASVITGGVKLALAFIFILLGYNIAGALGALLVSILIGLVIYYFPLRRFISLKPIKEDTGVTIDSVNFHNHPAVSNAVNYKEILSYLFPVAISYFCLGALVNLDMVLVKYFFLPQDSGLYALAQMLGKIFLFFPGAITFVMFPRTSALNAKKMETLSTLSRSLLYVLGLCLLTVVFYNFFPALVLKILTGKVYPESIILGRLFSISMSFFTLLFTLISYFLSIRDLRFIKYLLLFTGLQFLAIVAFHNTLTQVQLVLCINSILLFFIHLLLTYRRSLKNYT